MSLCGIYVGSTANNKSISRAICAVGKISNEPFGLEVVGTAKYTNLMTDKLDVLNLADMKLPDEMGSSVMAPSDDVVKRDIEQAVQLRNSRPAAIAYWAVRLDPKNVVFPREFTVVMQRGGFPGTCCQTMAALLTRAKVPDSVVLGESATPVTFERLEQERKRQLEAARKLEEDGAYAKRVARMIGDFKALSLVDMGRAVAQLAEILQKARSGL
jgi:muconolactone delta-isomerase